MILVLPGWFRRSAGGEMVDVFRAHLVRRTGAVHALRVWGVALADLLDTAVAIRSRRAPDRVGYASDDGMTRRVGKMIDQLRQDVHFAIRTFSRQPGMILAAVLTLALGIGGSTAIFSVVNVGVGMRSTRWKSRWCIR